MEPNLAATAPLLWLELGTAHSSARRWQEAHDAYAAVLILPNDDFNARAYRGMGFALIELERLDDAEKALNTSLKLDPNNASTKGELAYIEQLRRGGPKQSANVFAAPQPAQ
jgi:Flp pilus assembly protein TadD